MKPSSVALRALLATRQFFACDLYTFNFVGGGTLTYCGGDQDVVCNGIFYPAGAQTGPYFDRTDNKALLHWKVGTATDTLVFDVLPGASEVFGDPFLTAVWQGQFDNAELILERLFMPTYGDATRGSIRMFVGRVAEIDAGRSIATFTINDHREFLNLNLPRNLIQPTCVNNLGDAACGVTLSSFSTGGTVTAGSTNAVIHANITNGLVGYYDQGTITFTSGALNGLTRSIRSCAYGSPGSIALIGPFPVAPSAGDTFTAYAGCNKIYNNPNGCPKFYGSTNALLHFRGDPFVPQPAVAV